MATSNGIITTQSVTVLGLDVIHDSRAQAELALTKMREHAETFGLLSVEEYLSVLDHAERYRPGYESIGWTKTEVFANFAIYELYSMDVERWKFKIITPPPHAIDVHKTIGELLAKEREVDTTIKANRHLLLLRELNAIYIKKNHDYGDSFHKTYMEEGFAMSRIRLADKLERFKSLSRSDAAQMVNDESIRDTLMDLANYAIMTVLEMDDEKAERGEGK